jgi:hypothetical protein
MWRRHEYMSLLRLTLPHRSEEHAAKSGLRWVSAGWDGGFGIGALLLSLSDSKKAGFANNGAVVGPDDGVDADGVAERRAHFATLKVHTFH